MVTYGWKERHNVVDVVNALYGTERVRHLGALGESMGAAVALQAAAIEPRIEGVVAEDAFADLREVSMTTRDLIGALCWGGRCFFPRRSLRCTVWAQQDNFSQIMCRPRTAVAARPVSSAAHLRHGRSPNSLPACGEHFS